MCFNPQRTSGPEGGELGFALSGGRDGFSTMESRRRSCSCTCCEGEGSAHSSGQIAAALNGASYGCMRREGSCT